MENEERSKSVLVLNVKSAEKSAGYMPAVCCICNPAADGRFLFGVEKTLYFESEAIQSPVSFPPSLPSFSASLRAVVLRTHCFAPIIKSVIIGIEPCDISERSPIDNLL